MSNPNATLGTPTLKQRALEALERRRPERVYYRENLGYSERLLSPDLHADIDLIYQALCTIPDDLP